MEGSRRKAGPGRPKGSPNKVNMALRTAILSALDEVGGKAYIVRMAEQHPRDFACLLRRVLPFQPLTSNEALYRSTAR